MAGNPSRNGVPWLLTTLAVVILLYLWFQLYMINTDSIATGQLVQVDRNTVLSKNVIDASGLAAALVVLIGVAYRARKRSIPLLIQEIMHAIRTNTHMEGVPSGDAVKEEANQGWGTVFSVVFKDVLLLGRMGECEDFQQWLGHFLTMWGFIGLAATTTLDAILNSSALPLPITHPVRLLGNATGIMLVAGVTLSFSRRLVHEDVRMASRAGDWTFLIALYGTALTGFVVQSFADTSNVVGTALGYPLHLAFIALLLVAAPWSKFVHALWRPSWLVYTRLGGRHE